MSDPRTPAVQVPGLDQGPEITSTQPQNIIAPQQVAPTGGLQLLSGAFNNFFGKGAEGLQAIDQATNYAQRQEIMGQFYLARGQQRQQAEQNSKQGAADALSGQQNPALAADHDYATAYAKVAGQQHGMDLFSQWYGQVYQKAGPGDNLAAQTGDWLKQEWGKGTGNPDYDAAALSHFKGMTDRLFLEHQQNSVKAVVGDGLQKLDSVVAGMARSGQLTPDNMNALADQYRKLNPMNSAAAPLQVAHALAAGYDGTPAYAQHVSSLLAQPGTGVNGKSFNESFPEQAQQVQKQLVSDYTHVNSVDGYNAYQQVKEDLFNAKTEQDYTNVLLNLQKVRQQYGGAAVNEQLRQQTATQLEAFAEQKTSINSIGEMAGGSMATDPKVVNKYLGAFFTQRGINPYDATPGQDGLSGAQKAAAITANLGMAPDDLKLNMSKMLEDPSNVKGQIAAYTYYSSVRARMGNDPTLAKSFMSEGGKTLFDYVDQQRQTQGDNLEQIFTQADQNLDVVRKGKEISWANQTGLKEGEAQNAVNDQIKKELVGSIWSNPNGPNAGVFQNGTFSNSENVTVDPMTLRTISDGAKNASLLAGRNGQTDWKGAIHQYIQNAQDRLEIIPGFNGSAMVRNAPELNPNVPYFGIKVKNPDTKQYEDTLATYRGDVGDLAKVFPGIVPDTNRISIATQVAGNWPGADRGVYQVQRDGLAINFVPGQDLDVLGTKQTLSKDFPEAGKQLQVLFPQIKSGGWVLVPNDPVSPSAYTLGYRPRLTGEAPPMKSLDQKASEYQGSPAQTQRNQQQQIQTQFPAQTGGGL